MNRIAIAVVSLLGLSELAGTQAEPPASRSGTVLFKMPAGWQRQEMDDFTALNAVDPAARKYAIGIRPPAEAKAKVEDALAAHVAVLEKVWKVQPATQLVKAKHPAGYDTVVRGYVLSGDNGLKLLTYVYILQTGKKSVAIEFIANQPQNLDAKALSDFVVGCRLAHAEVVAAGDPALTLYDLEETIDCIQWLLDAPFTADQRRIFRDEIVDGWKKKDAETIQSIGTIMEFRTELLKLPEAQRDVVRKQTEKELVVNMRKETDRCSRLAVEIYEAAHKPIAEGDPPLTRQQADSALELFYFIAGQLEGIQAAPTAADKDAWAKRMASEWPKLEIKSRKLFEAMPLTWAATRVGWREMSEAERDELKKGFAQLDFIKEMRTAFAKAKTDAGPAADASALQAKLTSNYNMTSSMLNMGFNSTMSSIASFRNMTDSYNRWSYKPR